MHSLSSQPIPLLGCPCREKVVPYALSKPLLFQLFQVASHYSIVHSCEEPGSSPLITSSQALVGFPYLPASPSGTDNTADMV